MQSVCHTKVRLIPGVSANVGIQMSNVLRSRLFKHVCSAMVSNCLFCRVKEGDKSLCLLSYGFERFFVLLHAILSTVCWEEREKKLCQAKGTVDETA